MITSPVELAKKADDAFLRKNVSARGEIFNTLGEAAAADLAMAYGLQGIHDYKSTGVKPADGKLDLEKLIEVVADDTARAEAQATAAAKPMHKSWSTSAGNPWSAHRDNVDPATGAYSKKALARQDSLKRADPKMAASIAASAGVTLTATRPAQKVA
jgi:hypothetical protein